MHTTYDFETAPDCRSFTSSQSLNILLVLVIEQACEILTRHHSKTEQFHEHGALFLLCLQSRIIRAFQTGLMEKEVRQQTLLCDWLASSGDPALDCSSPNPEELGNGTFSFVRFLASTRRKVPLQEIKERLKGLVILALCHLISPFFLEDPI